MPAGRRGIRHLQRLVADRRQEDRDLRTEHRLTASGPPASRGPASYATHYAASAALLAIWARRLGGPGAEPQARTDICSSGTCTSRPRTARSRQLPAIPAAQAASGFSLNRARLQAAWTWAPSRPSCSSGWKAARWAVGRLRQLAAVRPGPGAARRADEDPLRLGSRSRRRSPGFRHAQPLRQRGGQLEPLQELQLHLSRSTLVQTVRPRPRAWACADTCAAFATRRWSETA